MASPQLSNKRIAIAVSAGALLFGVVPLTIHFTSEQTISACNSGQTEACSKVLKNKRDRITNKTYLDALERQRIERENELARRKAAKEQAQKEAAAAAAKAEREKSYWRYNAYTDDATGKTAKQASLTSENTIDLEFPYSGAQYGTLVLRKHPRYGYDAYLKIREGQILCNSYSNDTVLLRSNRSPATAFSCGSASDYSSDVVFIRNFSRVEQFVKGTRELFVTINLYGNGNQTFRFKSQNFDSSRL